MTDNNEKRMITVEGKVRKFKLGNLEINTIDESMTDEEYEVVKYLLSLDETGVALLIEKVVKFKMLNHDNDFYKEALIEEIKFLLN